MHSEYKHDATNYSFKLKKRFVRLKLNFSENWLVEKIFTKCVTEMEICLNVQV